MNVFEGNNICTDVKIAIICSRWNDDINTKLINSAEKKLLELGVDGENISLYRVPGGMEIPRLAATLVAEEEYDAIVCQGTLLDMYSTFSYECEALIRELLDLSVSTDVPVINGIIMAKDKDEALKLADENGFNFGAIAVMAAMEIISLERKI
jgi:6,7-dimethyl-8-ribityllumazine synthase